MQSEIANWVENWYVSPVSLRCPRFSTVFLRPNGYAIAPGGIGNLEYSSIGVHLIRNGGINYVATNIVKSTCE